MVAGLPLRSGGEIPTLEAYVKSGGETKSYPYFVEYVKNIREQGMRKPISLEDRTQGKLDLQPKQEMRPAPDIGLEMKQQKLPFDAPLPTPSQPPPLLAIGGSGERGQAMPASAEAISKMASQKAAGETHWRVNPSTNEAIPLTDIGRADYNPPKGTATIIQRLDGSLEVISNKSSFANEGLINRSKSILSALWKERGGPKENWAPAETRDRILSLFKPDPPVLQPKLITNVVKNLPAPARKTQTFEQFKQEMLTTTPEGELRRTYFPMKEIDTVLTPLQPGYKRQSPVRRWVFSRVLDSRQKAENLANTLMYGTEFKGFHNIRTIPRIEHTLKGGITRIERLLKTNPNQVEKIHIAMQKFEGIKNPTIEDLKGLGLNQMEAETGVAINKMLTQDTYNALVENGIKLENKPGYLPHIFAGPWKAWAKNVKTGEEVVIPLKRKWSRLPEYVKGSDWEVNVIKSDMKTPLGDLDFNVILQGIDSDAARSLLETAITKKQQARGFKGHTF